jgi:hypothetical protein
MCICSAWRVVKLRELCCVSQICTTILVAFDVSLLHSDHEITWRAGCGVPELCSYMLCSAAPEEQGGAMACYCDDSIAMRQAGCGFGAGRAGEVAGIDSFRCVTWDII